MGDEPKTTWYLGSAWETYKLAVVSILNSAERYAAQSAAALLFQAPLET